jgi:radical SAM protein with 4Fe4S-binding SPASM domain
VIAAKLRLATDYLLGRAPRAGAYPPVVGIEPTNNCNLDCVFCPRQEMTRQVGDMNTELFERIVDDLRGRVEFIWLQDYGEPFLNRNIFQMIRAARARGLRTGVSTNATVMTDRVISGILDSGLDYIIFAFDGATRETYEKVRLGANFDQVTRNIRRFLERKNETKAPIYVCVQCICMQQTRAEIRRFIRAWRVRGVNGVRIRQLTYSGNDEGGGKHGSNGDGRGRFRNDPGRRPCYWLWSNPHIKQDGTVVPCCQDVNGVLAIGNVREQSLGEIWNGEKMQRLRRLHLEGRQAEIPLCRGCNMYQPAGPFVFGSAFLPAYTVNRLVPTIETLLSIHRY